MIKKREGNQEEFNPNKIVEAVSKAYKAVGEEMPEEVKENLLSFEDTFTSVEEVQDAVEKYLVSNASFKVAKAYILYREQHKEDRELEDNIKYMDSYANSNSNAATLSNTDPNANVTQKNVANMEGEVYKVRNRRIQRRRMKKVLTKLFGKELAEQYIYDIEHHIVYPHDEASTPAIKNYCEAVTLYPLAVDGTSTMDGLKGETAPKNLNGFCGQLVNLTFLLASQCKGAVAYGELFNFLDYYCKQKWGPIYHRKDNVYTDSDAVLNRKTIGQEIEQAFQQFVYGVNQPAGNRLYQSPLRNLVLSNKF